MKTLSLLLGLLALPLALAASPQTLTLDPLHSTLAIDVKATVDSFTAHAPVKDAVVTLDPTSGTVTAARAVFAFNDIKTGKVDRDQAMHEWQETSRHPTVTFTLVTLTPEPDGRHLATGDLTLHGRTRRVTFPVSLTVKAGRCTVDGTATLDTRDYGLPVIRKFAILKVAPEVRVRFHLEGQLPSA